MSQESINREMFRYKKEISNGTTTLEEVLDKLHKTCFAKPNVPDAEFLAACRKYDPNFSPVSSAKERQARAELTERVHQELVPYQIRK